MSLHEHPVLGISACLLGQKLRFNGRHNLDKFLRDEVSRFVRWVPVCPEVECGLGVPREPVHIEGTAESPRLIIGLGGADVTERLDRWTETWIRHHGAPLHGFILKSRSPTCGRRGIRIAGSARSRTSGMFARHLIGSLDSLPVEEAFRLGDPAALANFIRRVLLFMRWEPLEAGERSLDRLKSFQAEQELLLLAHSAPHWKRANRLLEDANGMPLNELYASYIRIFREGLNRKTTVAKHLRVFRRIEKHFRNDLTVRDRKELFDAAWRYHRGEVPLLVPLTLLRHFASQFDDAPGKHPSYLNPHPLEIMLGNHA